MGGTGTGNVAKATHGAAETSKKQHLEQTPALLRDGDLRPGEPARLEEAGE